MWSTLLIIIFIVLVFSWLMSFVFKDGYNRAYNDLINKGVKESTAKIIARLLGVLYMF